jgi:hypothetical protein
MNVLIITVGSRGDVQPYVALGKGLKQQAMLSPSSKNVEIISKRRY